MGFGSFSRRKLLQIGGLLVLLFFLIGYILFPALRTVEISLFSSGSFSSNHYIHLLTDASGRQPLIHSIVLGLLSVVICGGMGIVLAFLVHFFDFPGRTIVDKLLLLPMVMPGIIIVFAFVQLYGESGMVTKAVQLLFRFDTAPFVLSGLPGILMIHAYTQYVYFYIVVSIAIRHIDMSAVESARILGATRRRVFFTVILPFLRPAMIAGCAMTFISGAGSFTAPSIIGGGYKVLTTQILLSKANNYMDVAATQVTVLTCISIVFFLLFRYYENRSRYTASAKGSGFVPIHIKNRWLRSFLTCIGVGIVFTVLLPILTIILVSFVPSSWWMVHYFPRTFSLENYQAIFTSSRKMQPFFNSMVMSLIAAVIGIGVGVPASFIIEKVKSRVRFLVEFLVMLPWAIPCSAVAINIINGFNQPSVFSFKQILVGTSILLPIGYLLRSLPILVKTLNVSFQNLNDVYIEASRSLGASGYRTWRKVAAPMLFPGILAAFLLVFIRSMGEYTVSVFLYNASNKPMSIAMVNGVFEYEIGIAMAYGSLLVLLTFVFSQILTRILSRSVQ